MGKPDAFLSVARVSPERRPVAVRLRDWREVYAPQSDDEIRSQASRCMDCGIPFCHQGCPLGNLIPEWNDLVYRGDWRDAVSRLHATNNFPEFTGRLCPAPCESACVVGISGQPVSIERTEYEIAEHGWSSGFIVPMPPSRESGQRVAVVGSGPAGLAAAQQLRRQGHAVTVFERDDTPGGLLRYGIPEFKMEKAILDRRLDQMTAEGVSFICNTNLGVDVQLEELRSMFDGVVLAIGSTRPRDLQIEGRGASGIHFAVDYLTAATKSHAGHSPSLSAKGRDVIILGGGDTGADCLGTALRQGAKSVTQLEIMPRPPESRTDSAPWPTMPLLYRVTSAHEEGGERLYAVRTTKALVDADGQISDIEVEPLTYEGTAAIPGEPFTLKCSMLLIAAGFVGADVLTIGGVPETPRGTIAVDHNWVALPADGALAPVVAAGDAVRGQSLIVWAIAEGRSAASCLDALLGGGALPRPLEPGTASW